MNRLLQFRYISICRSCADSGAHSQTVAGYPAGSVCFKFTGDKWVGRQKPLQSPGKLAAVGNLIGLHVIGLLRIRTVPTPSGKTV